MRIAELSARTGVPAATIKYYVREGLLPAGETTAPNQAQYGESHVARLQLIRALREGAGLSIAALGRVFAAMEAHRPGDAPDYYLTLAVGALSEPLDVAERQTAEYEVADAEVAELLRDLGWHTDPHAPGRTDLVRALVALHRFAPSAATDVDALRPYADAARTLAEREIPETFDVDADTSEALRFTVLGTVLFEPVLLALRKLAHNDRMNRLAARGPKRPGKAQRVRRRS